MLTKRQHDLLMYINEVMQEKGVCPSYEEMGDRLGLRSKSGVYRLIKSLEERGFVKRIPHKARALEILVLPAQKFSAYRKELSALQEIGNDNLVDIPLYGIIACGTPIEAVPNFDLVTVPMTMLGQGEHYALTVEGDSMKNAGIMDGDTVIIRQAETAPNGTIVVALVDGFEVTLKRIQVSEEKIVLMPENEAYKPRILEPDRVEIQGVLVGLLRHYH